MILEESALPASLRALPKPPKRLFYEGDVALLDLPKVAILGTRHPLGYTKALTQELARFFAQAGVAVASGGAFGVDILAHESAFPRTILILPSSLDRPYPATHAPFFAKVAREGLVLSEYDSPFSPRRHTFLERNRLIVALADLIIIPQADLQSGSMQSARIAHELGKPLYVLPHRLRESLGTHALLNAQKARVVEDFSELLARHFPELHASQTPQEEDEILRFCATIPSYEAAVARFGDRIFEYELEGKIAIAEGRVRAL